MKNVETAVEEIRDLLWFNHFETSSEKNSLAADILKVAADFLVQDEGDCYPPDLLREIANGLCNS